MILSKWIADRRYRKMARSLKNENRVICYAEAELCFLTDVKRQTSRKIDKGIVSRLLTDNLIEEISRGRNSVIFKTKGNPA